MKKIIAMLLFCFAVLVVLAPSYADETDGMIEIYPYGDPGALYGPSTIYTLVGDSNWDFEFNNYRYHIVRSGVKWASSFNDANADGYFSASEIGPALSWNAFASVIINDTEDDIELSTTNNRTDLTTVVQRIYTYYNQDGKLMMFEDHIFQYYIHNDGTDATENADWRLATESEKAAFIAAGADAATLTPNTRYSHIRMMVDPAEDKGYVLEPIGYLGWTNPDLVDLPENERSLFILTDPRNVAIPAGWTVMSFGTKDRDADGVRSKATELIASMPLVIADKDTELRASFLYKALAPAFAGITAQDDDPNTPGVQIVIDHNGSFNLSNAVNVSWVRMFDEGGAIINETEKLSYAVDIMQGEEVLETIEFVYDSELDKYTPSAAVTAIDTTEFGAAYVAKYYTTSPEGKESVVLVDVVVGVIPPRFIGISNRFHDEDQPIDLLGSITAVDGEGNDMTDDIVITYPASFNPFYPQPGVYKIDLQLTQHIHIEGTPDVDPVVFLNGIQWSNVYINEKVGNFTDKVTIFWGADFVYNETGYATMVIMEVSAEGKLIQAVDRTNWQLWNSEFPTRAQGPTNVMDSDAKVKAWVEAAADNGSYIVIAGNVSVNGTSSLTAARATAFDTTVVTPHVQGIPDQDHYIVINNSYTLTVDDRTAPVAMVVNSNYRVNASQFANASQAILANVVAYDNYDTPSQLAMFVESNGGLNLNVPGTYNVMVAVEDRAGNSTTASFSVTVVAAPASGDQLAALNAQITALQNALDAALAANDEMGEDLEDLQAELAALQAELAAKVAQLQDLIDSLEEQIGELEDNVGALPVDAGCAALFNVSNISLSLLGLLTLSGLAFFLFKRKY
ncbi:hypothetical protein JV173_04510 [Acholeplasma equirhinis]|uniref:hypothetical protein n=1 Tax=Acholeplasma equirhinis TaxID=555393 RepID=UPI00197AB03D|nr:hypothetical protein [Acholeplasma equirhinis]MBN3490773.1 hypothetical protein [Acholeplasma equirhinis]